MKLRKALPYYYTQQVLKKVDVVERYSQKKMFCMRMARAYRATEWVKEVTEYKRMEWQPEPLNPC